MNKLDNSIERYSEGYSQVSLMELNDSIIKSGNPLVIWERDESARAQTTDLPQRMGHSYVVACDVMPPKLDILL